MILSLKIKKFTELLLEFIITDYNNASDKQNSWLFRVLEEDIDDDYDFYENAIEVFVNRNHSNRRMIEVRNGFDPDRATQPTIHVREPAKQKGKTDSIGYLGQDIYENEDGTISDTAKFSKTSRFELMITGANQNEVILIQEVLESAMQATYESMVQGELAMEMDLVEFSSKEVIIANDAYGGRPLFTKAIELTVSYEKDSVPKLYTEENITNIEFNNPEILKL